MIDVRSQTFGNHRIRCIELSQPHRANCLSLELMHALSEAVRHAGHHPIAITARGDSFCSGLDLRELASVATQSGRLETLLEALAGLYRHILEHPAPTVCLVNGAAVAGGAGLACVADIVIASSRAYFMLPDAIPLLPRIPASILSQRCASIPQSDWPGGRVDADEALRLGLVDRLIANTGEDTVNDETADLLGECLAQSHTVRRRKILAAMEQAMSDVRSAAASQRAAIAALARARL